MVLPQKGGFLATAKDMERAMTEKLMEYSALRVGSRLECIMDSLIEKAENGDLKAAELILNRVMGSPRQTTENVNVNAGLSEWMEQIRARREGRV